MLTEEARVSSRNTLIALAAGLLVVSACGDATVGYSPDPETLTILNQTGGWHPRVGADSKFLVTLPLVERDSVGVLHPRLAESWEHSDDYREWTVHLRRDVRWHDGVPFTAGDIEFTVSMWNDPEIAFFAGGIVESVEVIDDYTLRIVFEHPQQLSDWWDYWPKHVMQELDRDGFWDWDYWGTPVGNGPYRVLTFDPELGFQLEATPDYFAGRPRIERVQVRWMSRETVIELLAGNGDLAVLEPTGLAMLGDDPRFIAYPFVDLGRILTLYWNLDHELFRAASVRRALTQAIDRRELQAVMGYPDNVPIVDWPFTERQYGLGELPDPLPYDPEVARRLLESAGWTDTNGDGILDKEGREFVFEAILPEGPNATRLATLVQAALREVGVRMELATMSVVILNPTVSNPDFEAGFFSLSNVVQGWMGMDKVFGATSQIGYGNPEMHRLVDEAIETVDVVELDGIYRRIMELCIEDVPVTFLGIQIRYVVAHRRVRGFPPVLTRYPMEYVEHLWLDEDWENGVAGPGT
jgi:peptide/nickel transport system substrate-binding protein